MEGREVGEGTAELGAPMFSSRGHGRWYLNEDPNQVGK